MTEAEWLACDDPGEMLMFIRERASHRKLRLFGCGCVRVAWGHLADPRSRAAVELAERYSDAEVPLSEREAARDAAYQAAYGKRTWAAWAAISTLGTGPDEAKRCASRVDRLAILWDLFGNPFQTAYFDTSLGPPCITSLAQAAYAERHLPSGHLDPARLAVLSDALEEAGCADAALLSHLRSPGPHVRGCWALDLVLGKE
jgi:hypothetical protein